MGGKNGGRETNVFETEVAKYERRIHRIERNPSSSMLKSNRLFYMAQLEDNRAKLKAWQQGVPFWGVQSGLTRIMRCFGDFPMLNLVRIADRLGTKRAEASFDKVMAMGLPEYTCDRTVLFLPLAMMGNEMPKLQIMVANTGACEVTHDTHRTLARLLGIPVYTIDIPFEDPHQEHLGYVVSQLEELIRWVEATVPGARFDERRLIEQRQFELRWGTALHEINELRKHVPCPDHPRDVFREPMRPSQFLDPTLLVEYYESYRDELRDRVGKGFTPVGDEKLRIVWAITGPYGSNIWDHLTEWGVSVPYWHYGGAERAFTKPGYGDMSEFGRKLSPIEEIARMLLYNSWAGIGKRWVEDTISACKEHHADGLVQFEQTGCQPIMGMGEMVSKRVGEELGIPCWRIEGRQLLGRTERIETEFLAGLKSFIDSCFENKRGKL